MKLSRKILLIGGIVIVLLLAVAGGGLAVSHAIAATSSTTTSPAGSPSAANSVAIHYVDSHYAGKGQAHVQQTEADVEHGVPVYDIRIQAPNGSVYVVHVQRSNNAVLSVNQAESQSTSPSQTPAKVPSTTTSPAGSPSAANSVAIHYVNSHYAGKGQAHVLKTEADVEHGVPVYDIRIQAPNNSVYVVHVQRSNNAVLAVNQAESQSTSPSGN
ncbi:MAG: PepSY domain-containing protein [Ktedonobacteraceae bacterium]